MNDLISVIVLIDNVESFINLSLQSIIRQSYKKMEILIMNKGCKDNTIKICEYYAKNDKRIHIVNIDARTSKNVKNEAIKKAKGKYVTFIDAGDIVDEDYIEYMYALIKAEKADIVCLNAYDKNKSKISSMDYNVYGNDDILKEYLDMNLTTHHYAKLYKKNLFKNILYPENYFFDDFKTTYKLYEAADVIVENKINKYCVVDKKNKICVNDLEYMKKIEDCFELLDFIKDNYSYLVDNCKTKICYEAIDLFLKVENKFYKKQLFEYIKLYRNYALRDTRFSIKKKTLCIRTLFGYHFMCLSFYIENLTKAYNK